MTQQMLIQKLQLKVAINYLDLIEDCDKYISEGNSVNFYKKLKEEQILLYANLMSKIVRDAIAADEKRPPDCQALIFRR